MAANVMRRALCQIHWFLSHSQSGQDGGRQKMAAVQPGSGLSQNQGFGTPARKGHMPSVASFLRCSSAAPAVAYLRSRIVKPAPISFGEQGLRQDRGRPVSVRVLSGRASFRPLPGHAPHWRSEKAHGLCARTVRPTIPALPGRREVNNRKKPLAANPRMYNRH